MPYGSISVDQINNTTGYSLGAGNASLMKNRIINGAMVIDQRNAGASVTVPATTNTYIVDRFLIYTAGASKVSGQQSSTAPAGFVNSLLITSLAATTPSSGDLYMFRQGIEGYNISDFNWGSANAKTVTLSFWVRSSLTGTFGGCFTNGDVNRGYPFTYTVLSANTWEQKSITVTGDQSGSWNTTNGTGIRLYFNLGSGSSFNGTAGTWASITDVVFPTGTTSLVGTNGATFYITGVQLEVGSVATGYEYRFFGQELQLCQRYFETSFEIGVAPANGLNNNFIGIASFGTSDSQSFSFKVMKRSTPTMTYYSSNSVASPTAGQWQFFNSSYAWANGVATQTNRAYMSQFSVYVNSSTNLGVGQAADVAGHWTASAEL